MNARALWIAVAVVAGFVFAGCGPVVDDFGTLPSGKVCYVDADCVPNDCCGQGSGAVHLDDAPDCRGIKCDGTCDPKTVDCGCGLPVCRDQRCSVARTVSDACPG